MDGQKPNLGQLLTRLGNAGVAKLESSSGLLGLGSVVAPLVAHVANDLGGKVVFQEEHMAFGNALFELMAKNWDRITSTPIVEQPKVEPVRLVAPPAKPLAGIHGFIPAGPPKVNSTFVASGGKTVAQVVRGPEPPRMARLIADRYTGQPITQRTNNRGGRIK